MYEGSREYLRVRLSVTASTAQDTVNLEGATVDLRVGDDPHWWPAELLTATVTNGVGTVRARLLIGYDTPVPVSVGEHRVLARLTTATEAVVVEARPWLSVASA